MKLLKGQSECECDPKNWSTVDSRYKDGYRYRRKHCAKCGNKWSTVETAVEHKYQRVKQAGDTLRSINLLASALGELMSQFKADYGEDNWRIQRAKDVMKEVMAYHPSIRNLPSL